MQRGLNLFSHGIIEQSTAPGHDKGVAIMCQVKERKNGTLTMFSLVVTGL